MNKKLLLAALALALLPALSSGGKGKTPAHVSIMSFNIRMSAAKDGTNSWNMRRGAVLQMLQEYKPDVMGVQEAMKDQVDFLNEFNDGYKSVGVGRDDGRHAGEHMSIFYSTRKIKLIRWGTYWLSETPEKPSRGWDADCLRTATWALLKDRKSGRKFYYVNTHLDHKGEVARDKGLQLVLERIAQMNREGYPLVLGGDFNVQPQDPVLKRLDSTMKSARKHAVKSDDSGTFNGWGKMDILIDYIYYSGFGSCSTYEVVKKQYAGKAFLSDHYPIVATLVF